MSKKRITIVALVIVLITALTIFTFVNKKEDEKLDEGNKTKTEIIKEEEKEEDTLTVIEDETTLEPVVEKIYNNPTTTKEIIKQIVETVKEVASGEEEDEYYLKALTAVVSAESTVDDGSYDAAIELVEKVKNKTKKENLFKRLEEVEKALDTKALVEELEEKVENAASKEDLETARSFRDDNELYSKIDSLNIDYTRDNLESRVLELNKLLNDTDAPVLNVEDGKYYNKPVVTATDVNEFELILSSEGNEDVVISNNTEITEEGIYTLKAIDKAYNEVAVTFTVDNTAPVFIGIDTEKEDKTYYYNKDVEYEITTEDATEKDFAIEEENLKEVIITKDEAEQQEENNNEVDTNNEFEEETLTTLTEEGTYNIKATDKAGNESIEVKIVIDKTRPTATLISDNQSTFGEHKYVVTMETSEPISSINNNFSEWTKVDDTHYTRVFEGSNISRNHSLKITDLAGNVSHTIYYSLW